MIDEFFGLLRRHLRHPGFFAAISINLGIGFAFLVTVLTLGEKVFWPKIELRDPDRLFVVEDWAGTGASEEQNPSLLLHRALAYRAHTTLLDGMALLQRAPTNLSIEDDVFPLDLARVSANYFEVLGAAPFFGRFFSTDEEATGANRIIVLAFSTWQKRFGGSPTAIGQNVTVGGEACRIVGILPPTFGNISGHPHAEAYRPQALLGNLAALAGTEACSALARVKSGVTSQQAEAELAGIAIAPVGMGYFHDQQIGLRPRLKSVQPRMNPAERGKYALFLGAASCMFLVACVNAVKLLLLRVLSRKRVFGIMLALGASQSRIQTLLILESASIVVAALGLGLGLAQALLPILQRILPEYVGLDVRLGALAVGGAAVVALGVCIVLPAAALRAQQAVGPVDLLHDNFFSIGGRVVSFSPQNILTLAQVALTTCLLTQCALLGVHLRKIATAGPGFTTDNRLFIRLSNVPTTGALQESSGRALLDRLEHLLGVKAAALSCLPPFDAWPATISTEDRSAAPVSMRPVSSGYFSVLAIPFLEGRTFSLQSNSGRHGEVAEAVVNRSFARTYCGQSPAIGRRFKLSGIWDFEVVGVVADSMLKTQFNGVNHVIYFAPATAFFPPTSLVVSLERDASPDISRHVSRSIYEMFPQMSVDAQSLSQEVRRLYLREIRVFQLASLLGVAAVVLTSLGLFASTSFEVAQTRGVLALKLALGAQPQDILSEVLAKVLFSVGCGYAIGVVLAGWLAQYVSTQLNLTSGVNPALLLAAGTATITAALLAALAPALDASQTAPASLLKGM